MLIGKVAGQATSPGGIGVVLANRNWRIVWATPRDGEPGVFLLRRARAEFRLVDVWGGPTSDLGAARRWAAKTGAPSVLARCFAKRLVEKGP